MPNPTLSGSSSRLFVHAFSLHHGSIAYIASTTFFYVARRTPPYSSIAWVTQQKVCRRSNSISDSPAPRERIPESFPLALAQAPCSHRFATRGRGPTCPPGVARARQPPSPPERCCCSQKDFGIASWRSNSGMSYRGNLRDTRFAQCLFRRAANVRFMGGETEVNHCVLRTIEHGADGKLTRPIDAW